MTSRDFGLDALRASAILLVLAYHTTFCVAHLPAGWSFLLSRGWIGVDLFFVLSGFLIARQVLGPSAPPLSLGGFWRRRWTRTLPLYAVALFVYAVVKPLFGFAFPWSWRFLVFLQNTSALTDFVQSWSLCIEEQFYIALPLVLLVVGNRVAPWVWLIPAAGSIAMRAFRWHELGIAGLPDADILSFVEYRVRFGTLTHLDGLSAGMFLAATERIWASWSEPVRRWLGRAGFVIVAASSLSQPYAPRGSAIVWLFSLLALGFSAMLVGAHGRRPPRVGAAFISSVALWSYGAYLWNPLWLRAIERTHGRLPWPLAIFLFLGATFALSWATHVTVEKWGMRLRARPLGRPVPDLGLPHHSGPK